MNRATKSSNQIRLSRRKFLLATGAATTVGLLPQTSCSDDRRDRKKSVAAIVTIYRKNSHTDVLIGKILEGWKQKGGPGPDLKLASMYVDQLAKGDMARDMSRKHGFPIFKTIEQAITLGTDRVAVDGIISIGEHGAYPWNKLGQHLYPRRRFFEEIIETLEKHKKVVPVFNDKHPGPVWKDALWMYNRAKELKIPFMAGSSLPVSFRKPDFSLTMNSELEACLAIGYSGLDIYGFHTLEYLQCIIERRKTSTQAVKWVQCLPGSNLKKLIDEKIVREDLLKFLLKVTPTNGTDLLKADSKKFFVFLIQHADGLLAPVLMLPGFARGISAAVKVKGSKPMGGLAEERGEPFPHFAYLLKGIEQMIHTNKPAYPVERTLLTAGILDRLLNSKFEDGKKRMTPELKINYDAVNYPHAPQIDLAKSFLAK